MNGMLKKRWISLYVENQIGVLSKISGLFSAKCYNLESLTVGRTEDPTISRMTIETHCDEETFEQIKKQLNRMVEVIKVIDFTDLSVCMKEILYVKIRKCTLEDKTELFQIAQTFRAEVIDYGKDSMLLEFLQTATKNDAVVKLRLVKRLCADSLSFLYKDPVAAVLAASHNEISCHSLRAVRCLSNDNPTSRVSIAFQFLLD